jgi:hypothetical protein
MKQYEETSEEVRARLIIQLKETLSRRIVVDDSTTISIEPYAFPVAPDGQTVAVQFRVLPAALWEDELMPLLLEYESGYGFSLSLFRRYMRKAVDGGFRIGYLPELWITAANLPKAVQTFRVIMDAALSQLQPDYKAPTVSLGKQVAEKAANMPMAKLAANKPAPAKSPNRLLSKAEKRKLAGTNLEEVEAEPASGAVPIVESLPSHVDGRAAGFTSRMQRQVLGRAKNVGAGQGGSVEVPTRSLDESSLNTRVRVQETERRRSPRQQSGLEG